MSLFGILRTAAAGAIGILMLWSAAMAEEPWVAWVDAEPPGPEKLIVTGTVSTPNPGYQVRLVREADQGNRLVLRLEMRPSSGVWAQVIEEKAVRYEEAPYSGSYETVVIQTGTGPDQVLPITREP